MVRFLRQATHAQTVYPAHRATAPRAGGLQSVSQRRHERLGTGVSFMGGLKGPTLLRSSSVREVG